MRKDIDILLDDKGDLLLDTKGVPIVGDVTEQNQVLILSSAKGDWKLYPLVGVGAFDFVEDESPANLLREIRQQLKNDGFKIENIKLEGQKIQVNAKYL